MSTLKYTVIRDAAQYEAYSDTLAALLTVPLTPALQEEIDLLTLLIETWDHQHNAFPEADPVQLLRALLTERGLSATALATRLGVSKSLVSDVLNYKKGFSKEMIRALATEFKLRQEAFNRPYALVGGASKLTAA
jgi:HTH-type transcriptional regulator / antitoxin HigA